MDRLRTTSNRLRHQTLLQLWLCRWWWWWKSMEIWICDMLQKKAHMLFVAALRLVSVVIYLIFALVDYLAISILSQSLAGSPKVVSGTRKYFFFISRDFHDRLWLFFCNFLSIIVEQVMIIICLYDLSRSLNWVSKVVDCRVRFSGFPIHHFFFHRQLHFSNAVGKLERI